MPVPAPTRPWEAPARDHRFHAVHVAHVVAETADASSLVLAVPEDLRAAFGYEAGQFCTFRAIVDGVTHLRCYSMSSTPGVDDDLQVTVKRVPGGVVSNWLLDTVEAGSTVDVTVPAGVFTLAPGEDEIVAFAAGSGITPVFSLLKQALAETNRPVRLLYANRDRDSVIFAGALDDLAARHGERLRVAHRLDVDDGFVDHAAVRAFLGGPPPAGAGFYLCGPAPFMDVVERALVDAGAAPSRIHVERFGPAEPAAAPEPIAEAPPVQVTVDVDGRSGTVAHRPGTTILQTARELGLSPPYSCESGSCATCMAKVVEGSVRMHVNNALTDEEVADGWVLTCQSVPTSPAVHVVYGFDDA